MRRMKPEFYTKTVLTIIALMLAVIACKPLVTPKTNASGQAGHDAKITVDNWDDQSHGSVSSMAKLSYVNKRCRMWANGEIDIDQTCLVVRTVRGLVVIPNVYVDEDVRDPLDKWRRRFYEIGGGEKAQK